MRNHLRRFIELSTKTIRLETPVFEFGALQVHGDSELEDLRPLFPGQTYVGCDMRPGAGVDMVLNLHHLDLPDASVGTAICMDTMEHVEYPRQAIDELHRVLQPNGVLIMSSVMNFPIHGYPNDYWRFTPEGFRSLLKNFNSSFVGFDGPEDFPRTIVAVAFKGEAPDLAAFNAEFLAWQARNNKNIEHITRHGLKS
ncbi:methyltransferase domain-containing protein [Aquipseudomonas guryensis]|jgi:SAM-dependent methyltransferase|uniref:Methyltransferase domain-containing protein n=1 Tax=Aquipseudomonas guryensis TaxID=2759165 RepID=A0A7W4D9W5_9GAMM|nr:methyltransferase domain-containing protein [Pseudomonas guryensis]MBB1518701.1 methyltransferase domain-containing protein [Pseudomonas guryensis]